MPGVISPRLFYLEDLGKFKRFVFKLPKINRGNKNDSALVIFIRDFI